MRSHDLKLLFEGFGIDGSQQFCRGITTVVSHPQEDHLAQMIWLTLGIVWPQVVTPKCRASWNEE